MSGYYKQLKNNKAKYIKKWFFHSLGVANLMYLRAKQKHWSKKRCEEMFMLGFFHDIGKRVSDDTLYHNKVGGLYLQSFNYPHYKEIYYHGEYKPNYSSDELDLLNACDMLVDKNGNRVNEMKRLQEVANEYGKYSKRYKDSIKKVNELRKKGWL